MMTPTSEEVYIFPVSFSQERLWFLDRLEPGNPSYNIFRALQLKGTLNIEALEQSLKEIQRRHEILRTTFRLVDEVPYQVISSEISATLSVKQAPGELSFDDRFEWARKILVGGARQPFNLSQGPLLRILLLELEEQSYILSITVHHIIADVWSMGVFIQELSSLYPTYAADKSSGLPDLPIQYADFAEWQRQWLTGEVLTEQLDYWQQNLSGSPTLIDLPTDYPRPPVQSYEGRAEIFTLTPDLTEKLNCLSQQSGVTLFMALLAAFSLLLSRYSQQKDILVGSPIANRNRKEIESLIGFL
ncbi:MAG: hypothetical protein HC769_18090 [Cyanobacteria bacterium CRU_2_1]|nr:hypothetical protein [Cyanobacteria bacterium CRU_2_1]